MASTVLREVREADVVLDVGTGSGIQAILAASRAKRVLAVDVTPEAVQCARRNVALNGFADRVEVIRSDPFDEVKQRFDLIRFDPPFRWTIPRDDWEKSTADSGYATTEILVRMQAFLDCDGPDRYAFRNVRRSHLLEALDKTEQSSSQAAPKESPRTRLGVFHL